MTGDRVRPETTPTNISLKTRPTRAGPNPACYMGAKLCMDAVFAPLGRVSVLPGRGIGTWSPIEYDLKLLPRISRSKPNPRAPEQILHAVWTRSFAWMPLLRRLVGSLP